MEEQDPEHHKRAVSQIQSMGKSTGKKDPESSTNKCHEGREMATVNTKEI